MNLNQLGATLVSTEVSLNRAEGYQSDSSDLFGDGHLLEDKKINGYSRSSHRYVY